MKKLVKKLDVMKCCHCGMVMPDKQCATSFDWDTGSYDFLEYCIYCAYVPDCDSEDEAMHMMYGG